VVDDRQSSYPVSPYHDNSGLSWTISALVKGTAGPVERHGVLHTLICAPVVRPKWCPTSSNLAVLPSWTVVCLSFTLLMLLLLPGWPIMDLNRIRKKKTKNNVVELMYLPESCVADRYVMLWLQARHIQAAGAVGGIVFGKKISYSSHCILWLSFIRD